MRIASVGHWQQAASPPVNSSSGKGDCSGRKEEAAEVVLSAEAQLHAAARRAYAESAASRAERVERLREQIAANLYQIDYDKLCDRILQGPLQGEVL